MRQINRYRTIWLSDFHLGTKHCRADVLLDFIRHTESDYLYLVGDIIDGWALRQSWYWHQLHNDIVQKLLRTARKGTKVTYIPGNHDEFAREFLEQHFGGILIKPRAIHTLADRRQLLVMHGDDFDGIVRYAPWLSVLGSWAYDVTLRLNRWYNQGRRRLGMPYWSLSAYLKNQTKRAVQYVGQFEDALAQEARRWEVDGVVCGHIHRAELRVIDGIIYGNSGDWVESCTALVEHVDGRLEVIRWAEIDRELRRPAAVWTGDGAAGDGDDRLAIRARAASSPMGL